MKPEAKTKIHSNYLIIQDLSCPLPSINTHIEEREDLPMVTIPPDVVWHDNPARSSLSPNKPFMAAPIPETPEKLKIKKHPSFGVDHQRKTVIVPGKNLSPNSKAILEPALASIDNNPVLTRREDGTPVSPGGSEYSLHARLGVVDVYTPLEGESQIVQDLESELGAQVSLSSPVTQRADYDPNNPYLQDVTLTKKDVTNIKRQLKKDNHQRKPNQNQVMGIGPNQAAALEGLDLNKNYHWGHICAFRFRGKKGQQPNNMLLMEESMNMWMKQTVEDACADLLNNGNSVRIQAYPILKAGYTYPVVEKLVYSVTINDNISFTLVYQPPYPQKPAKDKVVEFMQKIINAAHLLQERKKDTHLPVQEKSVHQDQEPVQDITKKSKPNPTRAFNFFPPAPVFKKQPIAEEYLDRNCSIMHGDNITEEDADWLMAKPGVTVS